MKATVGKLLDDFTPSLPAGFSIEKPQFGFIYGSLADQWYIVVILLRLFSSSVQFCLSLCSDLWLLSALFLFHSPGSSSHLLLPV